VKTWPNPSSTCLLPVLDVAKPIELVVP